MSSGTELCSQPTRSGLVATTFSYLSNPNASPQPTNLIRIQPATHSRHRTQFLFHAAADDDDQHHPKPHPTRIPLSRPTLPHHIIIIVVVTVPVNIPRTLASTPSVRMWGWSVSVDSFIRIMMITGTHCANVDCGQTGPQFVALPFLNRTFVSLLPWQWTYILFTPHSTAPITLSVCIVECPSGPPTTATATASPGRLTI